MADINKIIPFILKWEGGYAEDPVDRGGATMRGITLTTYKQWCKLKGRKEPTKTDLKNISDKDWKSVLKDLFWDKWKADDIKNQSIANLLVDWYWASGKYGIKYPQQILGVTVDCIVGKQTINAINNYPNQKELFTKLWNRRKLHFESIVKNNPSQKKFIKGWLNRLNDIRYIV